MSQMNLYNEYENQDRERSYQINSRGVELNPLSLKAILPSLGNLLSTNWLMAIILQDTTTGFIMCTHEQSFELVKILYLKSVKDFKHVIEKKILEGK